MASTEAKCTKCHLRFARRRDLMKHMQCQRSTNLEDPVVYESSQPNKKWFFFAGRRYLDYNAIFDPFNSKQNEVNEGSSSQVEFTATKKSLKHGRTENQLVRSAHLSSERIEGCATAATIPVSLSASVQTSVQTEER